MIYRGERGKPIAGLGGYQMFDSLAVEACGNVCVATLISGCISVIAPDGTLVEQVPTGDRVTTNIAFGGPGAEDRLHHAVRQGRTDRDGLGAVRPAAEFSEQVMMRHGKAIVIARSDAKHRAAAYGLLAEHVIGSVLRATVARNDGCECSSHDDGRKIRCPGLNR